MRRRWEVWAMYDPPTLMGRYWTKRGAENSRDRYWYPTRYWLDYEVRRSA